MTPPATPQQLAMLVQHQQADEAAQLEEQTAAVADGGAGAKLAETAGGAGQRAAAPASGPVRAGKWTGRAAVSGAGRGVPPRAYSRKRHGLAAGMR